MSTSVNATLIKYESAINTETERIIDITVVLYFFLFLFRFLYEMSPPIPNIFYMAFGLFTFLAFIFILLLFLIESIGDTLDALKALLNAEK